MHNYGGWERLLECVHNNNYHCVWGGGGGGGGGGSEGVM